VRGILPAQGEGIFYSGRSSQIPGGPAMRRIASRPGAIGILDASGYLKLCRPAVGAAAHNQVQRGVLYGVSVGSYRVLQAIKIIAGGSGCSDKKSVRAAA